ncbi:MAG: 30S ribosomal protein S4 [Candidatus Diapherotrites archaeon]|uniref:Small ribosomal subunit protein uS4 n=1 Tax=Candidatus Iainarchaeum sp. TaxID=3101447 RepID=A0A8T4C5X7_9ARCH|nr:30S ribosomal protein S4 [Candidatus Diapherotrites archaeon]
MGDPKFATKKYGTPKKPWDKKLLETERNLRQLYGLRNKREIRGMEATLRAKRRNAKNVLALPLEKRAAKEKELLDSLIKMGVMRGKPALQDVLSLSLESFLERRLQTIVWRKNLANSPKQARQFITHGHISVNGTKVTVPSFFVSKDEEATITYHGKPMVLQSPQQKQKDAKQLAKDFAQMRGEPAGTETKLAGEQEENPISPEAAEAAQEAEEGK